MPQPAAHKQPATRAESNSAGGNVLGWAATLLALAGLIIFGIIVNYKTNHHDAVLRIEGDAAVVNIAYEIRLPNPQLDQVAGQVTRMRVRVPWETQIAVEGVEPTVTLTVEKEKNDPSILNCIVIMNGNEKALYSRPNQDFLTCSSKGSSPFPIPDPEPHTWTPTPTKPSTPASSSPPRVVTSRPSQSVGG